MKQSTQLNTNREYKDRLFKFIFREKQDLLELYRKLLVNHEDLYSSRRIALPLPRFVIFYNGAKEEPERMTLCLHDSFPPKYKADDADLDCRATLININAGHNQNLMKKCRRLEEYSIFVETVRDYQRKDYAIEQAIDLAVEECVRNGILEDILRENREEVRSMLLTEYNEQAHIENERKIAADEAFEQGVETGIKAGTERFALLTKRMVQEARTEELLRAAEEKDFREKLYREYGETVSSFV